MIKLFSIIPLLLLIVKLYSGGVCIGEWKTKYISYNATCISFYGHDTGSLIKIKGTWTIEHIINEITIKR